LRTVLAEHRRREPVGIVDRKEKRARTVMLEP